MGTGRRRRGHRGGCREGRGHLLLVEAVQLLRGTSRGQEHVPEPALERHAIGSTGESFKLGWREHAPEPGLMIAHRSSSRFRSKSPALSSGGGVSSTTGWLATARQPASSNMRLSSRSWS